MTTSCRTRHRPYKGGVLAARCNSARPRACGARPRVTMGALGGGISRDPLGERAHRMINPQRATHPVAFESRLYSFVDNNPVDKIDTDGRSILGEGGVGGILFAEAAYIIHKLDLNDDTPPMPWPAARKWIPNCSIEIHVGHGLGRASIYDAWAGDPVSAAALGRLKHPYILVGTECSGAAVLSCGASQYAQISNPIPGLVLPDRTADAGIVKDKVEEAVAMARSHAQTICKNGNCCCKNVFITVVYDDYRFGAEWAGGLFTRPWPYFGHYEFVRCSR